MPVDHANHDGSEGTAGRSGLRIAYGLDVSRDAGVGGGHASAADLSDGGEEDDERCQTTVQVRQGGTG